MPGNLYCVQQDILSVHSLQGGSKQCVYVPAGTVIAVRNHSCVDSRLVEVDWDSRVVLMFSQDIQERAQQLAEAVC